MCEVRPLILPTLLYWICYKENRYEQEPRLMVPLQHQLHCSGYDLNIEEVWADVSCGKPENVMIQKLTSPSRKDESQAQVYEGIAA